jgi:hypothetical protein|tara:strand:- start:1551 stop:2147 length:597 start_codon:yes stop_codon:yes gene_type:complete
MALGAAKAAILAAAGSGEAYLGMEVIAEGVLSGTATNIELASIPADFTNLELVFTGRTTNSYGPGTCRFTVNNDTTDSYGSNYGYRSISYNYSSAQGSSNNYYNADTRFRAGYVATDGAGSPTGYFSMSRVYIYNYSQTTHGKNYTYISGTPGSNTRNFGMQFGGGYWSGTAAISEIDFDCWGDTMYAGSSWQLSGYG